MMKLIAFFFLAFVAMASAGLLGEGPEVYSAVTTKQVHSPFATSRSSRVQHFNDYTVVAPVTYAAAAPVAYAAAAPVAYAAAAPVAYAAAAPVSYAAAAPLAYSSYSHGYQW